ncbi:Crp/Fnr family transcriptional regulator [Pistricoccus aurantiacus]|uniref:Crp/Fnr family transcriptional regulator n=1 Tax=Pistricoccus aurantiacus TaxID=1883414 RepID=A0A5B8SRT7_9GAMM|nr:Crp/Fnr family transcriptional regulator [Pistricoccus aurantiacus]QEA39001.1 Crp/Fnr family transcriptional regulator [Pistricoccus aurantiacus]
MPAPPAPDAANRLIDGLPAESRRRLLRHCEPMTLTFGEILSEPHQPLEYVYFPQSGFISLIQVMSKSRSLEVGLVGNEGLCGASLVLGINALPQRALVQGAGTAWRLSAVQLQEELKADAPLRERLGHYQYVQLAQASLGAACFHFHDIEQRLARWLLMTQDRAQADRFYLTHEFLADMLGVRRSGVTTAAGTLQARALIHYSRGQISILDRAGLEATSCECYAITQRDYDRWLG